MADKKLHYDRYASRAWATKMPALRTKRAAATTSKNMGQPSGTNTGLNTMLVKKPARAAQSKKFESGVLILLLLMIPGNGSRRKVTLAVFACEYFLIIDHS
jgi:hypothetical protein